MPPEDNFPNVSKLLCPYKMGIIVGHIPGGYDEEMIHIKLTAPFQA